jgi:hypothetical protein
MVGGGGNHVQRLSCDDLSILRKDHKLGLDLFIYFQCCKLIGWGRISGTNNFHESDLVTGSSLTSRGLLTAFNRIFEVHRASLLVLPPILQYNL